MESRRSEAGVAEAKESMADTSRGRSIPPTPARSMARRRRSGPWGRGGSPHVKVRGEWYSSGGSASSGRSTTASSNDSNVRGSNPGGRGEVERPAAPLFGVQVDFPGLAQRVRLDEMALVVHVEAVVIRMVLQIGDIARHV